MPGWQKFYEENQDENFELISIAMDVQGVEKALPWLKKANATYVALLDNENKLGSQFNFKYIPLTILFDETGQIVRGLQHFSEKDSKDYQEIANWLKHGNSMLQANDRTSPSKVSELDASEAELRFQLAALHMKSGKKQAALVQLKKALEKNPGNFLILKQIWAIENPERFYKGKVDFSWQRKQLELMKKEQQK